MGISNSVMQATQPTEVFSERQRWISEHIWRKNRNDILFYMSTTVFEELYANKLISEKYAERFTSPKLLDDEKRSVIYQALLRSGRTDFLLVFIDCLRKTQNQAGEAHIQLAKQLEEDYNDLITNAEISEMIVNTTTLLPGNGFRRNKSVSTSITVRPYSGSYPSSIPYQSFNGGSFKKSANNKLKGSRLCHVLAYGSSLLWLVAGIVAVVSYLHFRIQPSQPETVDIHSGTFVFKLDLGLSQYLMSGADVKLTIPPDRENLYCTAELYVVQNSSACGNIPTFTTESSSSSKVRFLDYFLEGSRIDVNISNRASTPIEAWFVKNSAKGRFSSCNDLKDEDCANPPSLDYTCVRGDPGSQLPTYYVNETSYVSYCSVPSFRNPIRITKVAYNISGLRDIPKPFVTIKPLETDQNSVATITMYKPFEFRDLDYCLLLYVEGGQSTCFTGAYDVNVKINKRKDVLLFPLLIAVLGFVLHVLVVRGVHMYFKYKLKKRSSAILLENVKVN